MPNSLWQGTADGHTAVFTVPFPYLNRTHVQVFQNDVPQLIPADYSWQSDGVIQFLVDPPTGTVITIKRATPAAPLVTYSNGPVLTALDLNTASLQSLYRTEEIQDALNAYITDGLSNFNGAGVLAGLTPDELIDQVAAGILNSALAADLQASLTDIGLNAESILDQNTRLTDLEATVAALATLDGGIAALVTVEQDARITGDAALAETLTFLGAMNGGNTAFVLDTSTVQVSPGVSMADFFTGLTASVGTNTAAIASEATARASADTASASTITSLQTTVAGNTASIATQSSSIAGLSAQFTVKIDVNGHVAGFGLASTPVNGTPFSSFIVEANSFAVVDPGNGLSAPIVPFVVTGGVVFMENVVINGALIQDATILTAKIGIAQITTALIADAAITTAKIGTAQITDANIQNATISAAKIANATITNAQIANATITNAQIANATITSALIGDLQVTTAHIANLSVGTDQVANGAITGSAANVSLLVSWTTTPATPQNLCSFNYTSIGGVLVIQTAVKASLASGSITSHQSLDCDIFVDGVAYDAMAGIDLGTPNDSPLRPAQYNGLAALALSPGSHAVAVRVRPHVAGGGTVKTIGTLVLVEYKR